MATTVADARSTVLLVDDEAAALETTAALLSTDFRVLAELSPSRALSRLRGEPVDVLCTGYQLPGLNGLELIHLATELRPALVCVLVTGYSELLAKDLRRKSDRSLVLIKPYAPAKLLEQLHQAESFAKLNRLMAPSKERRLAR